jgi:Response regulator containing a CheY-like receiver domain and an HD-GYP domain
LDIDDTKSMSVDDITLACVRGFVSLVESKDGNTGRHIERIQKYSQILAIRLSQNPKYKKIIDDSFIVDIYNTSALHDIGKVGIPDGILLKQGKLSYEEFEVIKKHTLIGANVLKEVSRTLIGRSKDFFEMAIQIAVAHHEKYDGSGYPNGSASDDIPIAARIVAIVDVLDALTSMRPYKLPLDLKLSIDIIEDGRGKHFAPDIVDAFLLCKDEITQTYEFYKDN